VAAPARRADVVTRALGSKSLADNIRVSDQSGRSVTTCHALKTGREPSFGDENRYKEFPKGPSGSAVPRTRAKIENVMRSSPPTDRLYIGRDLFTVDAAIAAGGNVTAGGIAGGAKQPRPSFREVR